MKIKIAHLPGLFCLLCLFLFGCDRPAVFGARHPAPEDLPALSMKDAAVGADLDENGLRAHVAALIFSEVDSLDKRKAWIDYSQAIQSSFSIDPFSDGIETSQIQQRYVNALACVRASNSDDEFRSALLTRIHALTMDSSLRKGLWQSFQSVTFSRSIKPKSDPCSE